MRLALAWLLSLLAVALAALPGTGKSQHSSLTPQHVAATHSSVSKSNHSAAKLKQLSSRTRRTPNEPEEGTDYSSLGTEGCVNPNYDEHIVRSYPDSHKGTASIPGCAAMCAATKGCSAFQRGNDPAAPKAPQQCILRSEPYCDTNTSWTYWEIERHESEQVSGFCATGVANRVGTICCAASCGRCGGEDCESLPGGSDNCCSVAIKSNQKICGARDDEPCLIPQKSWFAPDLDGSEQQATAEAQANADYEKEQEIKMELQEGQSAHDVLPPEGHNGMSEHEAHDAAWHVFVFPICTILFGLTVAFVLHRWAPSVPYTPMLLVVGFLAAIIGAHLPGGAIGPPHLLGSIEAWEQMNGHLILYVFIPPLIFGEAMGLDYHVLKRCLGQCLLLAVPAVALNTLLTALVAYYVLPYEWPAFALALAFGAVCSATDPVAVVALLKTLGVSPALTMLIGGESLLNDGTAMVMFSICLGIALPEEGVETNYFDLVMRMVFGSLLLGLVSGFMLLAALRVFSNKLERHNAPLQIALTLVAAYANFYVCEAVLHGSGVLSLVVMGAVCAFGIWPLIVNPEQMKGMWHTLEWILNTLLFQLVGLIIGYKFFVSDKKITDSGGATLCWAIVTYLFLLAIRLFTIVLLLPILKRTGYGMSWQGALVAWWGGLRGALGLALALVMEAQLEAFGFPYIGHIIVIHVSVVAVLTLLVNAPTTAPLLRMLGMVQTPNEKRHALSDLHIRMEDFVYGQYQSMIREAARRKGLEMSDNEAGLMPSDNTWRLWILMHVSSLKRAVDNRRKQAAFEMSDHQTVEELAAAHKAAEKLQSIARGRKVRATCYEQQVALRLIQNFHRNQQARKLEHKRAMESSKAKPAIIRPESESLGATPSTPSKAGHLKKEPSLVRGKTQRDMVQAQADARMKQYHAEVTPRGRISRGWTKLQKSAGLDKAAAMVLDSSESVDHHRRRHELRMIFFRMVKRNYGEMTKREQLHEEQIALCLMHCVNYGTDEPDEPLREWMAMLRELKQPVWRLKAAEWNLGLDMDSCAPFKKLARLSLKPLIGKNHTQFAALMLICYMAAHGAAMKELYKTFGDEGGHYELECEQVTPPASPRPVMQRACRPSF